MSLNNRRLPWQQPMQVKLREKYCYTDTQVRQGLEAAEPTDIIIAGDILVPRPYIVDNPNINCIRAVGRSRLYATGAITSFFEVGVTTQYINYNTPHFQFRSLYIPYNTSNPSISFILSRAGTYLPSITIDSCVYIANTTTFFSTVGATAISGAQFTIYGNTNDYAYPVACTIDTGSLVFLANKAIALNNSTSYARISSNSFESGGVALSTPAEYCVVSGNAMNNSAITVGANSGLHTLSNNTSCGNITAAGLGFNAIIGNAMNASLINTAGSAGSNTIIGNTGLAGAPAVAAGDVWNAATMGGALGANT